MHRARALVFALPLILAACNTEGLSGEGDCTDTLDDLVLHVTSPVPFTRLHVVPRLNGVYAEGAAVDVRLSSSTVQDPEVTFGGGEPPSVFLDAYQDPSGDPVAVGEVDGLSYQLDASECVEHATATATLTARRAQR